MDVSGDNLVSRVREETYLQDRLAALLLAIFSGLIFFDMTAEWPTATHDGVFHIRQLEALTDALRTGVIYPRWFPDSMLGFGKPVLNYYPPGFYYPAALLHLSGLDLVSGIRVTFSLGFALSAWWMYRFSRLFVSLWPAIVSVVCFQFFPYRISDLFVRGAFPEFSAFFWLPAVALYTLQAATADKEPSRTTLFPKSLTMAGLAWAGLILTHNLSALMAVLVLGALLTLIFVFQRGIGVSFLQVLVRSIASVVLGMLLTAWYILPALLELRWVMNGHGLFSGIGLNNFLKWSELVDLRVFYRYMVPSFRPSLPIYVIPTALGALLAVSTKRWHKLRLFTLLTLVLTLGFIWLMTDTSSWFWFSVEALINQVQFPWRWQIFAALGVALLLAASLETLRRSGSNWRTAVPLFSLLISAYLFAYATVRLDYFGQAKRLQFLLTGPTHPRNGFGTLPQIPMPSTSWPVGSSKAIVEALRGWTDTLGTYCTSGTDQHSSGYADARDSSAASIPGHHGADIPTALPSVPLPSLARNCGRRSGGGPTCDRILACQRGDSSGHTYCRACVEGDDCGMAGPDCDCDRLAGCSISPEPRGESDGSLA